jgi:pimeloyl-ACP methyl ester carboxylesterase
MIYDKGAGSAVVVVPGVQGRWEWMTPALDAMSRECRVISYSLAGDFGSGRRHDPALGFENYVRQLDAVMDTTGLARAAMCGVSYGGFVAVRYAALRPARVTSLILASSPAPGWKPNARQRKYVSRPWLMAPEFVVTGPLRLWPEIDAAFDTWPSRIGFALRHAVRIAAAPMIPSRMASRITEQQAVDFSGDCARVTVPTLVISGEAHLDRVVPTEVTRSYERLIPGARYAMMERTGHIGLVTRPDRFSSLVCGFVHAHDH